MGRNAAQRVQLVGMNRVDKNKIIVEQLSIERWRSFVRFWGGTSQALDIDYRETLTLSIINALEQATNVHSRRTGEMWIQYKECLTIVIVYHSTGVSNKHPTVEYSPAGCRLQTRHFRGLPTAKTGWPKHHVIQYVRLALVEKEDVTLKDENLSMKTLFQNHTAEKSSTKQHQHP